MRRLRFWFVVGALCVPLVASAETMYITDHVAVALRADMSPSAPVLKTLTTGAALEVVERSGSSVRVRDGEGAEGWVEAVALIPQPPAAQQLEALRAELDRTRAQLIGAQTQLEQARAAPVADAGKLQAELTAMRAQLAEARAEVKRKEGALSARAASSATAPAAAPAMPVFQPPEDESGFSFVWLAIVFAMLVLGFIGGIVWVRESIRRRMGGMHLRI